jgi:hypothetical protein
MLLGVLGGCVDSASVDRPRDDRLPPGGGVAGPLRPRGPAGYADWADSRRADETAGPRGQSATAVAGLASISPAGPLGDPVPRSSSSAASVVNSKRLQINYEVKDVGPSGLAVVELWYRHNGGPWQKYGDAPQQPPFVVDVPDEGRYDFTLLARNRAAQGKTRPDAGDEPQVAVEVDLTKPAVAVVAPRYDPKENTLTLLWQATDRNLGAQPIALCWSRDPRGPWVPIITQLPNTGRYVWKLPAGLPERFWVQVEASDLAGNVATVATADAVALAPAVAAEQGAVQPAAAVVAVEPPPQRPARVPTLTMEPIDE